MKKQWLAFVLIAMVSLSACSTLKAPRLPEVNLLASSENQRTYQSDYDTVFRAAVDALRRVDNSSAKYVKHDAGLIIFKKPDNAGTITASVKKIDDRTTRVEIDAKNSRKFLPDSTDTETRDAFFKELDALLITEGAEAPPAEVQKEASEEAEAPEKEPEDARTRLIARLSQELRLAADSSFLQKLSYDELSLLDQRIHALQSAASKSEDLGGMCAACYIDLARLYHDSGQYARAAEALKIAIASEPDNAVAHCNLGEIYKHLRLFDDAVRELHEAQRLNPDLPDTYINLGIIYDDYLVDDEKALKCYNKYLELGGTDEQVREWIRVIEQGS